MNWTESIVSLSKTMTN